VIFERTLGRQWFSEDLSFSLGIPSETCDPLPSAFSHLWSCVAVPGIIKLMCLLLVF